MTLELGVEGSDLECAPQPPPHASGKSTYNLQLVLCIHILHPWVQPAGAGDWGTSLFYLFFVALGLCYWSLELLSRCSAWLLMAVASPAVKHGFQGGGPQKLQHLGSIVAAWGSLEHAGFSSVAHALSMWHVESSGRESNPCTCICDRFPTTGPPGKSDRVSTSAWCWKNPSVSGPAVQTHVVQGSTRYIYLIYVYVYSLLLRIHLFTFLEKKIIWWLCNWLYNRYGP